MTADAIIALVIMGLFVSTIMLSMRKISREYTAKQPRTFAELERSNYERY